MQLPGRAGGDGLVWRNAIRIASSGLVQSVLPKRRYQMALSKLALLAKSAWKRRALPLRFDMPSQSLPKIVNPNHLRNHGPRQRENHLNLSN